MLKIFFFFLSLWKISFKEFLFFKIFFFSSIYIQNSRNMNDVGSLFFLPPITLNENEKSRERKKKNHSKLVEHMRENFRLGSLFALKHITKFRPARYKFLLSTCVRLYVKPFIPCVAMWFWFWAKNSRAPKSKSMSVNFDAVCARERERDPIAQNTHNTYYMLYGAASWALTNFTIKIAFHLRLSTNFL